MPRKHSISDADFAEVVAQSLSVSQVIGRLGLVPAGGNYKTVQHRIARQELSTAHFTGKGWNTGKRFIAFGRRVEMDDALVENSSYACGHRLKKRLLASGLKLHQCENCGLSEWMGSPIALELHHCNGVNNDHRIENLQLLCPNCHALTDNYRAKNIGAKNA